MKRMAIMMFVLLSFQVVFGQWMGYYGKGDGELDGGIGMTWIDSQPYINLSFQPDISIGKFGVGLGINLLYNTDNGAIRKEDWDEDYDYARLIRYLRYGHKGDKVYARVGALDNTYLGHGFIVNFYNNQINYDKRKIGLVFDLDLGMGGVETMSSNLGRTELIGVRGYVRPLYQSQIPVLRNLAFGASYVSDIDPDHNRDTDDDKISFWGIDVELPLLKSDMLSMMLYADHAAVINPPSQKDMMLSLIELSGEEVLDASVWDSKEAGSGQAIGLRTDFNALWNLVNVTVQVERRFLNKGFIPGYFGPFYEVMRYTTVGELAAFYEEMGGDVSVIDEFRSDYPGFWSQVEDIPVQQKMMLPLMVNKRNGWYAGLYADFLKIVQVMGSYQLIDNTGSSGLLHLGAGLSQEIPIVALEATYDKAGIDKAKDIFTLDARSVARVGVGYKVKPYLLLYMDYIWTFQWDEDLNAFKPQERVQPRVSFRYPIDL